MLLLRIRYLLLQQLLLLLSNLSSNCATASSPSMGHGSEEAALVAIKAKISGNSSMLASWNQSTSYCSWEGVTCSTRHQLRVAALNLSSQGLSGTISPAIGNLSFLHSLNLSYNTLYGEIPPSIGSLRRLQSLDLTQNMLTGVIPSNISHCTSLRVMLMGSNKKLRGSIPTEIGNMLSLRILKLHNNSITGTIPSSFGNLSQLTILSLAYNHLQGSVPAGIGNNANLIFIQVSDNNLSGLLPPSLYNLSSLHVFYVATNKLHGRLPADLGRSLPSIKHFGVGGNQFTGPLPLSLTNLTWLQILHVELNSFTGVVPSELGRLKNLQVLVLDVNKFKANNEKEWEFFASLTNCTGLQIVSIGWNKFEGKIPISLANLSTNLQLLRILYNNISGVIPLEIGDLANLECFDLAGNKFTGIIPESIGKITQLNELYLHRNNFSGHVPSSIGNLTSLSILEARSNSLEGSIPPTIGNLSKLTGLDLSRNKLIGNIPNEIMRLSSISMSFDLSYNFLEGPLPLEVRGLVNLVQLILSGNKLSGHIPDTIGNCRALEIILMDDNSFQGSIPATLENINGLALLNLTANKLNGSIPGNLGVITYLQELYLSHNNLSGPIPELLGNSTTLLRLDLSFNNLQGEVPEEGIFRNLTGLSIVGNNGLCGGISQLHLPRCPKSNVRKNKKSTTKSPRIVIPTTGALLLLLVLFWVRFLYRKCRTAPKKEIAPQFQEIELPIVLYNDILKGTDGFSEANVLGKGRYGTVYRGTIGNQAIVVAVKVFNLQLSGSYKSFQAECEALRRVRHRCLVKIITCCSSIDHQGQDFRALVFECMENSSLDRWIHSSFEGQHRKEALSLSQRLDIAVDIVDALDYLHNGCQPPIVHCDLKPSNVLLNQDMRARVGDFGIARVLDESTSRNPMNSNSSIGIRGSIGYIAPGNTDMLPCASQDNIFLICSTTSVGSILLHSIAEYGEGIAVSTYGDVYSLGVTLIEMFTRRSPTDDMFRDGMSLHYFAEASLPHKVMKIGDSNIWLHDGANTRNDTRHMTRIKECLSSVIMLGVLCSKQSPIERPSMRDAAAEMHAIRDAYT